jgi:hypothetical protein
MEANTRTPVNLTNIPVPLLSLSCNLSTGLARTRGGSPASYGPGSVGDSPLLRRKAR